MPGRAGLVLALVLAGAAGHGIGGEPGSGAGAARLRAPDGAPCSRDHLTSYDGRPLRYSRQQGRTRITIRTDADTTETVLLRHPGTDDPSPRFRWGGQPFQATDWQRLEASPSRLRPGLRVIAWVCDDGSPPVVDWQPPPH